MADEQSNCVFIVRRWKDGPAGGAQLVFFLNIIIIIYESQSPFGGVSKGPACRSELLSVPKVPSHKQYRSHRVEHLTSSMSEDQLYGWPYVPGYG